MLLILNLFYTIVDYALINLTIVQSTCLWGGEVIFSLESTIILPFDHLSDTFNTLVTL